MLRSAASLGLGEYSIRIDLELEAVHEDRSSGGS